MTEHLRDALKHLRISTGLVLIPLAVYSTAGFLNPERRRWLMNYFIIILCIASFYCLVSAYLLYRNGAPVQVFFYHELVKPFKQHAIQLSILVFTGLIFLFETLRLQAIQALKSIYWILITFLSGILFLLSSKLILIFYLFYIFYFLFTHLKKNGQFRRFSFVLILAGLSLITLVLFTRNPVSNRFREIITGDMALIKQEKFRQGDYFNGLQFRLLQWKFVPRLLNQHHAWAFGLGPGDAQVHLDQVYISSGMYIGHAHSNDHGFLGYHTHNQFLQTLLQNGIAGLAVFLLICAALIEMMVTRQNTELTFLVLLLLIYCFADAVLETQYGLILFTFFPVFFYLGTGSESQKTRPRS